TRGSLSQFGDPRGQMPTYSLFRTADGWLFIGALTPPFLVKLMTVLERVDLLADPRLQGSPLAFGIPEIKDFVRRELDPILATRAARAPTPRRCGPRRPPGAAHRSRRADRRRARASRVSASSTWRASSPARSAPCCSPTSAPRC